MRKKSSSSRGAILATLAALCWGSATVMSKSVLDSFPPVFLLTLQLTASVVFLGVLIFFSGIPTPQLARSDWLKIASLGLLEPGLAYLLTLTGLVHTSASSATLIGASEAIMIIVLSVLLYREKTTLQFMALSVVAVGGLLVALGILGMPAGGGHFVGEVLIFAGTLAAALYVVLSGHFARSVHPLYIVFGQQTIALCLALLLLPVEWLLSPTPAISLLDIPQRIWWLAAASGIVQYALAFSLYIAALRTISANYAGSFLNLIPLFGLAAAFLFLGEILSWLQFSGALVTIIAVALINSQKAPT